jgi:hypothetical protein
MLRGEPQEQARAGYAARSRKKEAEATRLKAATDTEANEGRDKCVSRPGSRGKIIDNLATMREALACAGGCVAALERIIERVGLDAAAAAGKGPTTEEHLVEASGLRELTAGLELSSRYGSSENAGSASNVRVWHQSTELDKKSDDAAAAATARWAGEAALRNATNTTTTAAVGVRDGPSPFEPTSTSATDAGREAAATTKDMATAAAAGVRDGPSPF